MRNQTLRRDVLLSTLFKCNLVDGNPGFGNRFTYKMGPYQMGLQPVYLGLTNGLLGL